MVISTSLFLTYWTKIERTKFNAFRFTQNSQFYSNKTDVIEGRVHLMDFLKWFFYRFSGISKKQSCHSLVFSKNAEPLTNTMINKKHFSYLHWSYQIRFTLKKIYLGAKLGQHIYFGPIPATNTPQDTV